MTIEAKYTAGPWAEADEWAVPIAVLAEQILTTDFPDLPSPTSVSIQWPEGDEITYRLIGVEDLNELEDEAWFQGFDAGVQHEEVFAQITEETPEEGEDEIDFTHIGWVHKSGRFIPRNNDVGHIVDMSDWVDWDAVYKAA